MLDIYLTNYLVNGVLHTTEDNVLSVPVKSNQEVCMINPIIKGDMGKAESLDFTVNPGMAFYDAYIERKTRIRVDYLDTTIFYGQVKTVNTSSLLQIKQIHAEGAYTMLSDTQQEGKEEELQTKKTAFGKYYEIISNHNSQVAGEDWKHIQTTTVHFAGDNRTNEAKKRDSSSWTDTLSALDDLIENHGGYMRIRYDCSAGVPINERLNLEWHQKYYRDLGNSRPRFEVARNILDLSSNTETGELFTRVIPIGHKETKTNSKESSFLYINGGGKYISVTSCSPPQGENGEFHPTAQDFLDAENRYGIIYKTVNFSNADTASKLSEYANDWISKNFFGTLRTFTVKAVDLRMVGESPDSPMILVGDCVDILYPEYDQNGVRRIVGPYKMVCKSVQYNLFSPEQNTYTIGIPNDAIDFEYGSKKKKKVSTIAANADKATGTAPKSSNVITWTAIRNMLKRFYCTYNWDTYAKAQDAHAYSWRCYNGTFDVTKKADLVPYSTFGSHGEVFDDQFLPDNVEKPDYTMQTETITDANGDEVTVAKSVKKNHYVREFSYNGKSIGECEIYGYYDIAPNPYYKYGKEYGVGCKSGSSTPFAFFWSSFITNPRASSVIPISFYFPKMNGSASSEDDLEAITDTDGSAENAPATEPLVLIDPNTGLPNVEIFPDSGTANYGMAYHYEDPSGNKIKIFDENTSYAVGDKVVYNNTIYRFTHAHAAGEWNTDHVTEENEATRILDVDPVTGKPLWYVTLNTPLTYQDEQGNWQTIKEGCISCNDLALPDIPSFRTQVAMMTNAIIMRAEIGQLRAVIADIGNYNDPKDVDLDNLFENSSYYIDGSGNVYNEFNLQTTYEVGDVVAYNNKIYRFTKQHPSGTAWKGTGANGDVAQIGTATKINSVDAQGNPILKIKSGTRFANTNDRLQDVAGRFVLNQDGTMTILDGGGLDISRNGTKIGIWKDGEVTSGMVCKAVNGETSTKIYGTHIKIGSDGTNDITLGETLEITNDALLKSNRSMIIVGDLNVSKKSNNVNGSTTYTGGTITAPKYVVGLEGSIQFNAQAPTPPLVLDSASMSQVIKKIKIVAPETGSNTYTLKYLTYGKEDVDDGETSNWTVGGTFSRAASLEGVWSGIETNGVVTGYQFPLTIKAHPANDNTVDLASKTIGMLAGNDFNLAVRVRSTEDAQHSWIMDDPYVTSNTGRSTSIYVPYQIIKEDGAPTAPTSAVVFERTGNQGLMISAWPVWNKAARSVSLPQATGNSENSTITFEFPIAINGAVAGDVRQITYTLDATTENNAAYICIPGEDGDTRANYAKVTHGKYDLGFNAVSAPTVITYIGSNTEKQSIESDEVNVTATVRAEVQAKRGSGALRKTDITLGLLKTTYTHTSNNRSVTDNCVDLKNTSTGAVIGRVSTQSVYEEGKTAGATDVKIAKGNWTNGSISFTKSSTGENSQSISIYDDDPVWSADGKSATIQLFDGDPVESSAQSIGKLIEVDAENTYRLGYNAVSAPIVTVDSLNDGGGTANGAISVKSYITRYDGTTKVYSTTKQLNMTDRNGSAQLTYTDMYEHKTWPCLEVKDGNTVVGRYNLSQTWNAATNLISIGNVTQQSTAVSGATALTPYTNQNDTKYYKVPISYVNSEGTTVDCTKYVSLAPVFTGSRVGAVDGPITSGEAVNLKFQEYNKKYKITTQYKTGTNTWANGDAYFIETPDSNSGAARSSQILITPAPSGSVADEELNYGTMYKIQSQYVNASGGWSDGDSHIVLTKPNTHYISFTGKFNAATIESLQDNYTETLEALYPNQLSSYGRFFGIKVDCGTDSHAVYFQTPPNNIYQIHHGTPDENRNHLPGGINVDATSGITVSNGDMQYWNLKLWDSSNNELRYIQVSGANAFVAQGHNYTITENKSYNLYDIVGTVTVDVPTASYENNVTLTRATAYVNPSGTAFYYDKMYYYNAKTNQYVPSNSNHYWYYCQTDLGSSRTLYY